MGRALLAFVLSLLAVQAFPGLPSPAIRLGLGLLLSPLLLLAIRARTSGWVIAAAGLSGLLWAILSGAALLDQRPALPPRGEITVLTVRIVDFPQYRNGGQRLLAEVVSTDDPAVTLSAGAMVRISDYGVARVYRPGETWRLKLRLRAPRGLSNPGTFDYETWLFQQHIVATGGILEDPANARLAAGQWSLQGLRAHLAARIDAVLAGDPQTGLVRALALGDQGALTPEQWVVFRDTGTSHLAVISGQHILMAAAPVYGLTRWVWPRLAGLALRIAAPRAAAVALLVAAVGYSALAGFSVPTQRTDLMLAVLTAAVWWRRETLPSHILLSALALILALDPCAALAPGTWLSFGAVACLYYGMHGRMGSIRGFSELLRSQWVVTVGLVPILLLAFGRLSWVAPAVNLALIPAFSLLLLPLILGGTLLAAIHPVLGAPLLWAAAHVLSWLWTPWALLAAWPGAAASLPALGTLAILALCCGVVWMLAPRGFPGRSVGLLLILLAWTRVDMAPGTGALEVVMLDVGQGQAVLLRTAGHVLLYDAGPRMGTSDAVEWVVEPYLRRQGIDHLDAVVISHADVDHSGGAARLRQVMPVDDWLSGGMPPFPGTRPCQAGRAWTWDQVRFEILHPGIDYSGSDNEDSCVLRVVAPGGRVLLTGDIGRQAETALLAQEENLRAEVLVLAHHGSAGSSSASFLAAVAPQWALASAGYGNRWDFPRPAVRDRLARQGSALVVTGDVGAVRVSLRAGEPPRLDGFRCQAPRYWQAAPVGCPAKE
jgi:competence protein ComEC